MRTAGIWWRVLAMAAVAGLAAGGCTITVGPGNDDDGDDDGGGTPTPTTVTVRIVNSTTDWLDPQIFVGPPGVFGDALFVPEYKRTGFGAGGVGIIEAGGQASFTLNCGEFGVIATFGGIFGPDLGNPLDQGTQRAVDGSTLQCGETVGFAFRNEGNTLLTSITVGEVP